MRRRQVLALTGAGISTDSGIPDYRGPESIRKPRRPIQYNAFMTDPEARVRYWSRSAVGWRRFSRAGPNASHEAVATLEAAGIVSGVVTQNVDGLHQAAGSRDVVELHGSLHEVRCLACGSMERREAVQQRMMEDNPHWLRLHAETAPDGDAELDRSLTDSFRAPRCLRCGGDLKPDVVFFGENVPRGRVDEVLRRLERADLLLVMGSSLTVYSGYRFVLHARRLGIPVAIVNRGPTRADALALVKVDEPLGEVLPGLVRSFGL